MADVPSSDARRSFPSSSRRNVAASAAMDGQTREDGSTSGSNIESTVRRPQSEANGRSLEGPLQDIFSLKDSLSRDECIALAKMSHRSSTEVQEWFRIHKAWLDGLLEGVLRGAFDLNHNASSQYFRPPLDNLQQRGDANHIALGEHVGGKESMSTAPSTLSVVSDPPVQGAVSKLIHGSTQWRGEIENLMAELTDQSTGGLRDVAAVSALVNRMADCQAPSSRRALATAIASSKGNMEVLEALKRSFVLIESLSEWLWKACKDFHHSLALDVIAALKLLEGSPHSLHETGSGNPLLRLKQIISSSEYPDRVRAAAQELLEQWKAPPHQTNKIPLQLPQQVPGVRSMLKHDVEGQEHPSFASQDQTITEGKVDKATERIPVMIGGEKSTIDRQGQVPSQQATSDVGSQHQSNLSFILGLINSGEKFSLENDQPSKYLNKLQESGFKPYAVQGPLASGTQHRIQDAVHMPPSRDRLISEAIGVSIPKNEDEHRMKDPSRIVGDSRIVDAPEVSRELLLSSLVPATGPCFRPERPEQTQRSSLEMNPLHIRSRPTNYIAELTSRFGGMAPTIPWAPPPIDSLSSEFLAAMDSQRPPYGFPMYSKTSLHLLLGRREPSWMEAEKRVPRQLEEEKRAGFPKVIPFCPINKQEMEEQLQYMIVNGVKNHVSQYF